MAKNCSISAVLPVFEKVDEALRTIGAIKACDPMPSEIIVYIDGGAQRIRDTVHKEHPDVTLLSSVKLIGPGGARNQLVRRARHELVASFDDDSRPERPDYFAKVIEDFEVLGDIAVLSAASQESEKMLPGFMRIGIFSGCGCVFRKTWFLRTRGHVPLPIAYCMEEVDVSLQLFALGGVIVHDPQLALIHDRPRPERPDPEINAAVLANTALLPFLRYPAVLWPLGFLHVVSRLAFLARRGWFGGVAAGLGMIPSHLWRHRAERRPVPILKVLRWRRLCTHPLFVAPSNAVTPVLRTVFER